MLATMNLGTLGIASAMGLASVAFATSADDPLGERYDDAFRLATVVAGGSVSPNWFPHRSGFWFSRSVDDGFEVLAVDADGSAPFFDVARLCAALTEATAGKFDGSALPFRRFELADDGSSATFKWKRSRYELDLASYELTELGRASRADTKLASARYLRGAFSDGEEGIQEVASHDAAWFLGDDETNLWVRASGSDELRYLTDDGAEDLEWTCGWAQWSPDGEYVAAHRTDSRMCARLPVVDFVSAPVESVEEHPYTKAGDPMSTAEVWVLDPATGARVLAAGSGIADHYTYLEGWRPDGSEVLWQRIDRRYKRLELCASDPATGHTRVVVAEESESFVGALYYFVAREHYFHPLDEERFLWIAERDGWRHLYALPYDGGEGGDGVQLTHGAWEVEHVVDVDLDGGWVYFYGHAEPNPYETHLYRVGLDGDGFERLTAGAGEHRVVLAPDHGSFVDNWSSPTEPPRSEYRRADGTLLAVLDEADVSGLADFEWSPPEPFVVRAADGETELHGLLYKPADFDPNERYPVLDYIYNGPFTKWVPRTFEDWRGMQAQAFTRLGFCVLIVDGRGTIGRGKEFQDVVYLNWGRNEIPDHAAALQELAASRPYLDLDRVGMFGGSWGGYMTVRAMVTHPDVYHVGVASASVCDLYDHASIPIEGYMGLPDDHPEAYEYASSIELADQLEGKLLLVHGTHDVNATLSATMKMVHALVEAGKPHDLIVLPNQSHGFTGKAFTYWQRAQREYFVRHLAPNIDAGVDANSPSENP